MLKDLKVEYRKNPIGLDVSPRFSWKLSGELKDTIQESYQIQVIKDGKMSWDSGRVQSDQSILVPYAGKALEPMAEYLVKVNVWDNHGQMDDAAAAFETGLMTEDNWKAKWITHRLPADETACPVFVKRFHIKEEKIKQARIYATSCGTYEMALNANKVGDMFMAPGWTSYHHRLQYQTYDITSLLQKENEIALTVGNGWYKGYLGFVNELDHYGSQTAILAMIRLEYEDGSVDYFGTDTDWEVTTGVIISSEIYLGETQDYTAKQKRYGNAVLFQKEGTIGAIVAQEAEPVRITKRFPVKEKIVTPKGELVLDFGQNMAGFVEIKLPKLTGEKLVVRHGETLDKEGNFYDENLRSAVSADTYIYNDDEEDKVVIPHFTFHGFRYICIEGVDENVAADRFSACALHTDMEEAGTFTCDNMLVNQLQSNITWGERSNFLDIPTEKRMELQRRKDYRGY